jgi:4-amino-4-deoxychorismate lyase
MPAGALRALVDGEEGRAISPLDRGLAYGDGLFETLAVVDGRPRRLDRHLRRLAEGCRRLGLPTPDLTVLAAEGARLAAGVGAERAVWKLLLTRGVGGRGYRPPVPATATRISLLFPWPDFPAANTEAGVTVRLCTTRLAGNPALAGLKHLNRLEQVLARAEWDDPAVAEGLMADEAGRIVEGTMSNLFWVRDGRLLTPDLARCGVAGIARAVVLEEAAALGCPATVGEVTAAGLQAASEAFLCNSLIGAWPIRRLLAPLGGEMGRDLPVGPLTRRLQAALAARE